MPPDRTQGLKGGGEHGQVAVQGCRVGSLVVGRQWCMRGARTMGRQGSVAMERGGTRLRIRWKVVMRMQWGCGISGMQSGVVVVARSMHSRQQMMAKVVKGRRGNAHAPYHRKCTSAQNDKCKGFCLGCALHAPHKGRWRRSCAASAVSLPMPHGTRLAALLPQW